MSGRGRVASLAIIVLLAAAGACGGSGGSASKNQGTGAKQIKTLQPNLVPDGIEGLKVAQQDVSDAVQRSRQAYVDAFSLYGMRTPDDLLEATLEVTRFNPDAAYKTEQFRQSVVGQIGSSKALPVRMANTTVYQTTGKQQEISVWFQDRYLFVLSVRSDFAQPRALLRQMVGVKP